MSLLQSTIQYIFSGKLQTDLTNWWNDTINAITQTINGFIDTASNLGKNIVGGIISVRKFDVTETSKTPSVPSSVERRRLAFQNLLGIKSPSKPLRRKHRRAHRTRHRRRHCADGAQRCRCNVRRRHRRRWHDTADDTKTFI
jgi:hypothetical protein